MSGAARLIVGTSGSPGSLHALRYGEALARERNAVLIPVIAWELPGGDRDQDRIALAGQRLPVAQGVQAARRPARPDDQPAYAEHCPALFLTALLVISAP